MLRRFDGPDRESAYGQFRATAFTLVSGIEIGLVYISLGCADSNSIAYLRPASIVPGEGAGAKQRGAANKSAP
jgi:hypothetical protein